MFVQDVSLREETSSRGQAPHSIARIEVDQLFGRYDYRLPETDREIPQLSKLFVLYGDNGSGKTTILRLLFDLLSAADDRGHRSALAEVPFRTFRVFLADGTTIVADRARRVTGSYSVEIARGSKTLIAADWVPAHQREQAKGAARNQQWAQMIQKLGELNLAVYFMTDDRRVRSDRLPRDSADSDVDEKELLTTTLTWHLQRRENRTETVSEAMQRAAGWVREQTIRASNLGNVTANTIYADVATRISSAQDSERLATPETMQQLNSRLAQLAERSQRFAAFGLTSALSVGELLSAVTNAPPQTRPILVRVLEPHVDAMEARLNALQTIQEVVATFVGNVNSFWNDKHLDFDVQRGMQISTDEGQILSASVLSSGERQLLMLMCYALYARDQATVFLIDEPELSLNVKWQRHLLEALLQCISGSEIQLVIATHSIELISRYRDAVLTLRPQRVSPSLILPS